MADGEASTRTYRMLIQRFNELTTIDNNCRIQLIELGRDVLVLRIEGQATQNGYQHLAKHALDILQNRKRRTLIIDLGMCDQLSSSPLGMIGLVILTVQSGGGKVVVVTRSELHRRSLRILGFDKTCTFAADIDEVLDA